MPDQKTQHLFFTNTFGNPWLHASHQHIELIRRLLMRHVRDLDRSSDKDILNQRRLPVKASVEFVLARLRLCQWFNLIDRLRAETEAACQ